MSVAAGPLFAFEDSYVRELEGLYERWQGAEVANPQLVALNAELAKELGVDPQALTAPEGLAVLAGAAVPQGATPVAQAYAGHQFGGYSPRLGDGRALLLGEVVDADGRRRDVHLKGSGRTPFARGGDGKAAIGPMLRETVLPGAVLARVAASHLRVGTFEYAARRDPELVRRLADYAIARHYPDAAGAEEPYLSFFERVLDAQASLVARWMCVGFVHGVMNTDNMTISGETIDYGPCAFIDAFDPAAVFSSIDHGGRYAFANQPPVAQWNLARLAETLVPLVDGDAETGVALITDVLRTFPDRYAAHLGAGMSAKLGLPDASAEAREVIDELLAFLRDERIDYTSFFRALSASLRGDEGAPRELVLDRDRLAAWIDRWRSQLAAAGTDLAAAADSMDRVNPVYIPRNHLVEEALTEATGGDLEPFRRLLEAVSEPFDARPGLERYAEPAPAGFDETFRTFCGT